MPEIAGLLLTRRWIVLTVLAVAVVVAFGFLSHWQWDRAQREDVAAGQAADPGPVPIAELLGTEDVAAAAYGRLVSVTGRYVPSAQRHVARGDGYWVVTPLRRAGGPAVAVVRGRLAAAGTPPSPPDGEVSVVGRVEPFEGDPGVQPGDASTPTGQLPRLTAAAVQGTLDAPVAPAWLALQTQQPGSELTPVVGPSDPQADAGLNWQNTTYAVQWLLFAGFVLFLWQRAFRDELRARRAEASEPAPVS
ncbi:MAG TPA: SURF1 family protein [Candidatus Nanopelagicales bacterium]|nr:SURF1 family protein [Candidatus Nanopelagicales bacterium]